MNIAIANDHAGYDLKLALKKHLESKGHQVADLGTDSAESTDYPDYAHALAQDVAQGSHPLGVLICGSGVGVCIAANKTKGIRAALAWNPEVAGLSRQHNDANVLCLPSRFMAPEEAFRTVDAFLENSFEGGRHQRRVDKIERNS